MKFLAFTDIHGDISILKHFGHVINKEKVDAALCAGDITNWSSGTNKVLKAMNDLKIPVFFIHGNHDSEEEIRTLIKKYKNLHFVHNNVSIFRDEAVIVGIGGGGFSIESSQFEKICKGLKKNKKEWSKKKLIVLSHAPPYGTVLDEIYGDHVGNKNIRRFIISEKPIFAISGHIHETMHMMGVLKDTIVMNPGDDGELIEL